VSGGEGWVVSCDCLSEATKKLADYNTRPSFSITLSDGVQRAIVATSPIPPNRKPKTLLATYCPMCGKKYGQPRRTRPERSAP
jgi:hypothetical protein